MSEDEKLRFILIVSAIVAALAVYRFAETSRALAHSTSARFRSQEPWLLPCVHAKRHPSDATSVTCADYLCIVL